MTTPVPKTFQEVVPRRYYLFEGFNWVMYPLKVVFTNMGIIKICYEVYNPESGWNDGFTENLPDCKFLGEGFGCRAVLPAPPAGVPSAPSDYTPWHSQENFLTVSSNVKVESGNNTFGFLPWPPGPTKNFIQIRDGFVAKTIQEKTLTNTPKPVNVEGRGKTMDDRIKRLGKIRIEIETEVEHPMGVAVHLSWWREGSPFRKVAMEGSVDECIRKMVDMEEVADDMEFSEEHGVTFPHSGKCSICGNPAFAFTSTDWRRIWVNQGDICLLCDDCY